MYDGGASGDRTVGELGRERVGGLGESARSGRGLLRSSDCVLAVSAEALSVR